MNFTSAVKNTAVASRTTNGMKENLSSLNANLDLFFNIGAARGKDITPLFERAYQEDRVLAMRIAAWARDVRGGSGERSTFRSILKFVEKFHPADLETLVAVTPEYGRWDDVLVLETEAGKQMAFGMIKEALITKQNGLCAKWMPRKGELAAELRKSMGLTPKGYRKTLVNLTNVVETQMCAKDWENIDFNKVPSLAAARYQKAFGRNAPTAYSTYRSALEKGDPAVKINATAVYPYDVIKSINHGDTVVAKAQWDALPNFVGDAMVMPVCDTSGSMCCSVGGGAALSCLDVCISLGLYLADKNTGPFKDCFLTFNDDSHIEVLRGDIVSKVNQLRRAGWGGSTNLHSAFEEILRVGKQNQVADADMPKYLLIMSDMQFNHCVQNDHSAIEMIRAKYAESGYTLPNVIFWQLNAQMKGAPVTIHDTGTALVSGFSPSIMTSILKAEGVDPMSIMLNTVNAPRYQVIA